MKKINFIKMSKQERADYFSEMAIESLTKAKELEKEEKLAIVIRKAYYHNFNGFPPSEWKRLEAWEKNKWCKMVADLINILK